MENNTDKIKWSDGPSYQTLCPNNCAVRSHHGWSILEEDFACFAHSRIHFAGVRVRALGDGEGCLCTLHLCVQSHGTRLLEHTIERGSARCRSIGPRSRADCYCGNGKDESAKGGNSKEFRRTEDSFKYLHQHQAHKGAYYGRGYSGDVPNGQKRKCFGPAFLAQICLKILPSSGLP